MLLAERSVSPDSQPSGLIPLAGDQLLDSLRGPKANRQLVDIGLAGGLRAWLNDACFHARDSSETPLVITKKMVTGSGKILPATITYAFVRGALVATLFRLFVTSGKSENPFADACAVLFAEPQHQETANFVATLAERDLRGLEREIVLHARNLESRWPVLSPSWMPRTGVAMAAPLDGGRVILRGMADLAIGLPNREVPSICLVSVRSTPLHHAHREELRFLGLIETLRSGVPPFRLATYSTLTGEVVAEAVTEDLLKNTVMNTISAIDQEGLPK